MKSTAVVEATGDSSVARTTQHAMTSLRGAVYSRVVTRDLLALGSVHPVQSDSEIIDAFMPSLEDGW